MQHTAPITKQTPGIDRLDFKEGQLLLIDKPLTWTSFDVVNKIRIMLRIRFGYKKIKVGHAGTLDPLATGLLVVCTGRMTKQIQYLQASTKHYDATLRLGATTPSLDRETAEDAHYPTDHLTGEKIQAALPGFLGKQAQVPPAYSAKSVDGVRAYKRTRRGETPELKAVEIEIHELALKKWEPPLLDIQVGCSKGTYIRSLARDIGKATGSGAYLENLRRTRSGEFHVEHALQIDELSDALGLEKK